MWRFAASPRGIEVQLVGHADNAMQVLSRCLGFYADLAQVGTGRDQALVFVPAEPGAKVGLVGLELALKGAN